MSVLNMGKKPRFLGLIICLVFAMQAIRPHPAEAMMPADTTIQVDTMDDELNNDNDCSLREAIRAANTNSQVDACSPGVGSDLILLPAGVYPLTITGTDDNSLVGDLDILGDLVVRGENNETTIVDGGGIDRVFHIAANAVIQFEHLTIQNGNVTTSLLGGGGILNEYGTLTLKNVVLQNNHTSAVGGGMDNAATVTLIDSTINDNEADDGGGIFNGGTLFLYNSSIYGNAATTDTGGGLDNAGIGTLQNTTISGNSAVAGGGIFSDGPLNVTIVSNTALSIDKGGNVENADTIRIKNTIVANPLFGFNCGGNGDWVSEGHNLESTDTCNFSAAGDLKNVTDFSIGFLEDNEGPTWTHALPVGSLAIDAGDNVDCPEKDQRGASRPADGDGDSVKICDIGAFEYNGTFPTFLYLPLTLR
jgi:CSLREA domain-containing protein